MVQNLLGGMAADKWTLYDTSLSFLIKFRKQVKELNMKIIMFNSEERRQCWNRILRIILIRH
jgi:hypothetical protein